MSLRPYVHGELLPQYIWSSRCETVWDEVKTEDGRIDKRALALLFLSAHGRVYLYLGFFGQSIGCVAYTINIRTLDVIFCKCESKQCV